MDDRQNIDQFSHKLDRILQGLPPGRGELTIEDCNALAFAKRVGQIDLSEQSKAQLKARHHLEELATIRLPHASNLSPSLLFRPKRLSWIGLALLVQLVLGSLFGSMSAPSYTSASIQSNDRITPPAALSFTQSPEIYLTWRTATNYTGSEIQKVVDNPQPVPTPLAPLTNTVLPQGVVPTNATPQQGENPFEPQW